MKSPEVLAEAVKRAKHALDEIARWPDAVEASAAIDDVGVHLTRHLEETYAEADLVRACQSATRGGHRRG